MSGADPEAPIWHWSGDNRARAHFRVMAIETAVHRWDAENARGAASPVARPLALDGIAQTFEVMVPMRRRAREAPPGKGERYRFAPSDAEASWLLRFDADGVTLSSDSGDADVTVRGTASDLFLFLWQRVPAQQLAVVGDRNLLDRYFELVPPI